MKMTDNDVMVIVIDEILNIFHPSETFYIQLKSIRDGIYGKKHIEEQMSPRYRSIELWGVNIFPYSMKKYREMAEWIKENRK